MTSKANEAISCSQLPRGVMAVSPGAPPPPSFHSQPLPPSTPSPPSYTSSFGSGDDRPVRVVGTEGVENENYSSKSARQLSKVNLVMASILFLCQLVVAGCLCRPVVIMGGLWVAILVLAQAILGLHTSRKFRHSLVVGHAWLSGLVCLVCLAAAGYLFSGQMTVACVSTFHRPDHASVVRLYVVEVVSLVASLPCLTSAIVSLVSSALSARAACPPKKNQTPFVLYLPRWSDRGYGSDQQTIIQSEVTDSMTSLPPGPPPPSANHGQRDRARSPPPSYNQIAEESFA